MSNTLETPRDFVLVSEHGIAVPVGFRHVSSCPAGQYYGREGVTRQMIAGAVRKARGARVDATTR